MNYTKIYKAIMEKAKSENRAKGKGVYYESHHIIPDFMFKERKRKGPKGHLPGNPNDPKNLVLLTAREHILCHVLLAKALKGKRYWAQAASALTWFYTKVIGQHERQNKDLPGLMKKYELYRKMGVEGISKSRKGKFPAVDAVTRESVGSVDRDHPNVLSGVWVHHSKGVKVVNRKKVDTAGDKNLNARELDYEYIKQKLFEFDKIVKGQFDNNFIKKKFIEWFDTLDHQCIFYKCKNTNKQLPQKLSGMSTSFLNLNKLVEEVKIITNWNTPKQGMGAKYTLINRTFEWFTNGVNNIQIHNKEQPIPDGYFKGRTL